MTCLLGGYIPLYSFNEMHKTLLSMTFQHLKFCGIKALHQSIFLVNVMRLEGGCDYSISGSQETLNLEPLQCRYCSPSPSMPGRRHAHVPLHRLISKGDFFWRSTLMGQSAHTQMPMKRHTVHGYLEATVKGTLYLMERSSFKCFHPEYLHLCPS